MPTLTLPQVHNVRPVKHFTWENVHPVGLSPTDSLAFDLSRIKSQPYVKLDPRMNVFFDHSNCPAFISTRGCDFLSCLHYVTQEVYLGLPHDTYSEFTFIKTGTPTTMYIPSLLPLLMEMILFINYGAAPALCRPHSKKRPHLPKGKVESSQKRVRFMLPSSVA